ncbi:MAG: serine protease [Chloroflexia bacterium]|nr:serine protease [Chloroflexia bacterium]MDQ3513807.1 S1C family serine protease [Chloroflexota bacterium]
MDQVHASSENVLARLSTELESAVERASHYTVTVYGRRRLPGTGVIWSEDGWVVTANHIVERDEDLEVGLPDGRRVPATLRGRDPGSDLALLSIEGGAGTPVSRTERDARPGQLVLAIGRPGENGAMASFGIVNAVGGRRAAADAPGESVLRSDVAMLPGFSGGPLVDAEGAMVGLNTSMLDRSGGVTVRNAWIDQVVGTLREHGKVRQAYLGIGAQSVALPAALRSEGEGSPARGLLVVGVEPDGPADHSGIMLGDLVLAIAGTPVQDVDDLQRSLRDHGVGDQAALDLVRGGERQALTVTIGERP